MKSKKRLLQNSRLYVIIDKQVCVKRRLRDLVAAIKAGRPDIVQYRDKTCDKQSVLRTAQELRRILSPGKIIFIINDYLDVAKILNADGLHVGQDDISVRMARRILGRDKIIGVSCHNLNQALRAQNNGADYISIGPIFSTSTKPQEVAIGLKAIQQVKEKIKIPFFAIGGIDRGNVKDVLSLGARRLALCKAVCQVRNAAGQIRFFLRLLHAYTK